jgi:hypothetical protein
MTNCSVRNRRDGACPCSLSFMNTRAGTTPAPTGIFKYSFLLLAAILLLAGSGQAQTHRRQPMESKTVVTDIRRIDFLNYTYRPTLCSKVFSVPGVVKIRKGKFENNETYYYVHDNKIIYADVTGDGREDAIVNIGCGGHAGNFSDSEILVYTLQNGREKLLARLDSNDMERAYLRYYPDGFLVSITQNGVKVENGHVIVDMYANGSNAGPEFIASLDYKLRGTRLIITGKPQRRRTKF